MRALPTPHTSQVNSQIAVSFAQVGQCEGEKDKAQKQDGIERSVLQVNPVQDTDGQLSQQVSQGSSDDELYQECGQNAGCIHAARGEELDEYQYQHIGHGVVASAFQFEHGTQVVFQVHVLRAQDVEDRSRVGRRHGGSQQQGGGQRQGDADGGIVGNPPDEASGEQGGEQHSDGGEQDALCQHRTDVGILCIHATREQDDTQGHHANKLGFFGVVKLQTQAVTAEYHAHQKENQQGRYPKAMTCFAEPNADKKQHRTNQKDIFRGKCHSRKGFQVF